jgi:hypothetical protein
MIDTYYRMGLIMAISTVWIIVANDNDAAICASDDGTTQLMRIMTKDELRLVGDEKPDDAFATQILAELYDGVRNGACAGFILVAGQTLIHNIEQRAIPEISRLMIAQIVNLPSADAISVLKRNLPRRVART